MEHLDLADMERSTHHPILYSPPSSVTVSSAVAAAFLDPSKMLENSAVKRRGANITRGESVSVHAPIEIRSPDGSADCAGVSGTTGGESLGLDDRERSIGG